MTDDPPKDDDGWNDEQCDLLDGVNRVTLWREERAHYAASDSNAETQVQLVLDRHRYGHGCHGKVLKCPVSRLHHCNQKSDRSSSLDHTYRTTWSNRGGKKNLGNVYQAPRNRKGEER